MNNFLKLLIFLLLICSCTTSLEKKTRTYVSEYPVLLKINLNKKKPVKLQIPINLDVINANFKKEKLNSIRYKYNNRKRGIGSLIYSLEGNKKEIKPTQLINLNSKKLNSFVVYATYRLGGIKNIEKMFDTYLQKSILENKESIIIGNTKTFKKEFGELFNNLTQKDSIILRFNDNSSNLSLGNILTFPVIYEK